MSHQAANDPGPDSFRELAEQYGELIRGHDRSSLEYFLQRAHVLLARLYAEALALSARSLDPGAAPVDESEGDEEIRKDPLEEQRALEIRTHKFFSLFTPIKNKLGDERCYYRDVFDPYERRVDPEERGSLADDLVDTFMDLDAGLEKWGHGDRDGAVEAWRTGFEIHWGRHAVRALRALQSLAERDDAFPSRAIVEE